MKKLILLLLPCIALAQIAPAPAPPAKSAGVAPQERGHRPRGMLPRRSAPTVVGRRRRLVCRTPAFSPPAGTHTHPPARAPPRRRAGRGLQDAAAPPLCGGWGVGGPVLGPFGRRFGGRRGRRRDLCQCDAGQQK